MRNQDIRALDRQRVNTGRENRTAVAQRQAVAPAVVISRACQVFAQTGVDTAIPAIDELEIFYNE